MASYPWIVPYENQGQKLTDFPHLERWFEAIRARPATQRAYAKAAEINRAPIPVDEEVAQNPVRADGSQCEIGFATAPPQSAALVCFIY